MRRSASSPDRMEPVFLDRNAADQMLLDDAINGARDPSNHLLAAIEPLADERQLPVR